MKIEAYWQYLFDVPVIPNSSYSLVNFRREWHFRETLVNGEPAAALGQN